MRSASTRATAGTTRARLSKEKDKSKGQEITPAADAAAPRPGHRSDGSPQAKPGKVRSEKGRVNAPEEAGKSLKMSKGKEEKECICRDGWRCDHRDQPWEHDGCGAAGVECDNPHCTKDPASIFVETCCSTDDKTLAARTQALGDRVSRGRSFNFYSQA